MLLGHHNAHLASFWLNQEVVTLILRRVLQIMFIALRNHFQLFKILVEKVMLKSGQCVQ